MQKQRHRVAVRMDITIRLIQRYHRPKTRETGNDIQYNLDAFRLKTHELLEWYTQPETTQEKLETTNNTNEQCNNIKQYAKDYKPVTIP